MAEPKPFRSKATPRELVLRELNRGPRTLHELCQHCLHVTDSYHASDAQALVDSMVADGIITQAREPFGMRQTLRMTYRLAPK